MQITRTASQSMRADLERRNANRGCNVCPCCGESKSDFDYLCEGVSGKGIISGIVETEYRGFIFQRVYHYDCYSCLTCGASWRSEPYDIM